MTTIRWTIPVHLNFPTRFVCTVFNRGQLRLPTFWHSAVVKITTEFAFQLPATHFYISRCPMSTLLCAVWLWLWWIKPHLLSCCDNGPFNSGGALSDLSGVKRPPALLCGDREDLIEDYEIALIEPLHDLKNIINRVFDELPKVITEESLLAAVNEFLSIVKGKNKMLTNESTMWCDGPPAVSLIKMH